MTRDRRELGRFGERFVAWYLNSRYNIKCFQADVEGFDLLVFDFDKSLFANMAAIEIKSRERKLNKNGKIVDEPVNWNPSSLKKNAEKYGASPYFAHFRIIPEMGQMDIFLLSLEDVLKCCPESKGKKGKRFDPRLAIQKFPDSYIFSAQFDKYDRRD